MRSRLGGGALPDPARALIHRFVGFSQVVLSEGAVRAALDHRQLTVPYRERSLTLGLERFPLALDDKDGDSDRPHKKANELIATTLAESEAAHRAAVDAAWTHARAAVDRAGPRLDVIADLVDPTLAGWAEAWFGLRDQGQRLVRSSRMITHAMFFNPTLPKDAVDTMGLERATGWVHGHRRELAGLVAGAPSGTLAERVLAGTGDDADPAGTGDPDLAARHVLGLTVGPLALGSYAIANTIDHLLSSKGFPRLACAQDPRLAARPAFLDALRVSPPLPGVLRTSPGKITVPHGDSSFAIPRGPVLIATKAALRCPATDREGAGEPQDDGVSQHLAFGHGVHRCLGPAQVTDIASVVLAALAMRLPHRSPGPRGRIAPGPAPSGIRTWTFPGSLEVTFEL